MGNTSGPFIFKLKLVVTHRNRQSYCLMLALRIRHLIYTMLKLEIERLCNLIKFHFKSGSGHLLYVGTSKYVILTCTCLLQRRLKEL